MALPSGSPPDPAPVRPAPAPHRLRRAGLIAGIILVSVNLRPAITSLGPLLPRIRADLGLSGTGAGLLTMLPVLCLGAFAALGPTLRHRFGEDRVLLGCLPVLLVGILLRVPAPTALLYAGTVVIGGAIAVANVVLPSLIKREFPDRVPLMMATYTMALTFGGAAAAGAVIPLERVAGTDWRGSLGLLAVPVAVGALAWLPYGRRRVRGGGGVRRAAVAPLLRDRLAWLVTAFVGLEALLAYVTFGWLPAICVDRGLGEEAAGYMMSAITFLQAAGSMAVPFFVGRGGRGQRGFCVAVSLGTAAGLTGVVLAPMWTLWFWALVLGLVGGAAFSLALTLIGLRAGDGDSAAGLSSMSQGIGYALAAAGPFGMGVLHQMTGGWGVPLAVLVALCVLMAVIGLGAGRDATLSLASRPST
ncbi:MULTISPECIES: CynX/NimT family MFS transporter [unclassified Streptomyces]|uniref:CynX/NimT family MFS transporter n=1 Tax=unclassified Streptomyces TaxID=2593676 RepID=UPI00223860CC|nr:MFS transporter [Streptomyces sp. SHP 1-2]MCW5249800.1 MFS transporter [Streptomyces sp. SHP 1-2]